MKYLKSLAIMMMIAFVMSSCGDYKKTDTGLEYKFYVQNDGAKPQVGDFITIDMYYGINDSVLFDSKKIPGGLTFPLDSSYFKGDLFEGIMMMSKGDSASFKMSADSFFLVIARAPTLPPFCTPGDIMTFEIKLNDFQTKEEREIQDAQDLENMRLESEAAFAAYLDASGITTEPLPSGLIFIEEKKGKGPTPKAGEMVSVNLTVRLLDGTKIFASSDRGEPFEYEFGKKFDTEGLEEGVGMLSKGGKATLIVPHQIAYGAQGQGQKIPPYTAVVYDVELVKIRTKAEYDKERLEMQAKQQAEEDKLKNSEADIRNKFLKDNNITVAPTASGLYYIETEKGTGPQAAAGNSVYVHYTGKLLDGTVFDSSIERGEPFNFKLGVGQVIKGWDEGIAMMNQGGKATFIIPSDIAYGSRAAGQIPAYSTLVFDVELVEVEEAQ